MEGAEGFAGRGEVAVGRVGRRAGSVGVEGDDGAQAGVGPVDVRQGLLQQGPAGDGASAQRGELFAGGREVQVRARGRAAARLRAAAGVLAIAAAAATAVQATIRVRRRITSGLLR